MILITKTYVSMFTCLFFSLRLNLVFTHGIPPVFRGGVHLFIPPTAISSELIRSHNFAYRSMAFISESPPAQDQ